MSDIVERLRRGHHNADLITVGGVTHDGRCLVAADEIARLRADLAAAQEREQRMREALEKIEDRPYQMIWGEETEVRSAMNDMEEIARAALSAMRGEP